MTVASTNCWFNGSVTAREDSAPSIASISLHLGTSVFDGLVAYWNEDHYYLHRVDEHLVRFREGAARMGLKFPWGVDELTNGIHALLAAEPIGTQYVRPIAYRRNPELWVTGSEGRPVDVSIFTVRMPRDQDFTIACQLSPVERISSLSIPGQTKVSGAYVNSFFARKTAESAGFQDGLMFDRNGRLAEASAANVFLISKNVLMTPPLNSDVFPGITRKVILEVAARQGIPVQEADLCKDGLGEIQGAFLCSTLMEVRGIDRIGEKKLDTANLEIYRTVVEDFRRITHQ